MRYQLPALGGQLARKLPKFFIRGGLQKHFDAVERRAVEFIESATFPRVETLCPIAPRSEGPIRVLAAAKLGKTRLIDNIAL
jgi:pantothenate synthetase